MTGLATTRVAILRGTPIENEFGDLIDEDVIVPEYADLPASLIERDKAVYDSASMERRTIRVTTCRVLNKALALQDDDRVKDLRTGTVYSINGKTIVPRTLAGTRATILDLKSVTSA